MEERVTLLTFIMLISFIQYETKSGRLFGRPSVVVVGSQLSVTVKVEIDRDIDCLY